MKKGEYWKWMFPLCFGLMPILVQLILWVSFSLTLNWENEFLRWGIGVFLIALVLFGIWDNIAKDDEMPEDAAVIYVPLMAVFFYFMLLFVVPFGIGNYRTDGRFLAYALMLGALPWLPMLFVFSFSGDLLLYPVVQMIVYMLSALFFASNCARHKRKLLYTKRRVGLLGAAFLLCVISGYQLYVRSNQILETDFSVTRVEDEVKRWEYAPFSEGNKLWVPEKPPALEIVADYPHIDGATAAYPVYGAIVQSVYKGLDNRTIAKYVSCSGTEEAYGRLINGEIDVFFGAQPSAWQVEEAAKRGVEFCLTPVAREAFVFLVSRENPVETLTVGQIQDIYQKKIKNWEDLGGIDEQIIPFQRPENSGSQTIMQKVMGEKELPPPLLEEYASGMGGVIEVVASYRNYPGAIGYSFRYFATGMKENDDIRLLAVNGIEPSAKNIKNGSYPFTVDVYAVTTKAPQGNVKALIAWILTEEGQEMIEACGYVGI